MAVLNAARGLVTLQNEITRPEGSLTVAENVVIDADNIIQQRRGFCEFGTSVPSPKQLFTYKSRIIAHYSDKLTFDSTGLGGFTDFNGTYEELITGLRIKAIQANSNFYFTTNEGIKKISALTTSDITANAITDAGGIKAVDLEVTPITDPAGFLPGQSKAAYRLVYGTRDKNSNLILGVPSARAIITNLDSDIESSEIFTVNVLNHAAIVNSHYFTFDGPTIKYFVWFNVNGNAVIPADAVTLGRQGIEVNIQGLTTDAQVAGKISNVIASTVSEITVSQTNAEVTITVTEPGDVADAGNGNIPTTAILVTKIFDGILSPANPVNVSINFTLPETITTDYFYQLYRTAVVTTSAGVELADIDPGDEMQLVLEMPILSSDISAGNITLVDNTPENFRAVGAFLYTNPVTGAGILQANDRPPIATDITFFKNTAFYSNTTDLQRLQLNVLSVDNFVSGTTKFYIGKGDSAVEYTFTGQAEATNFVVKAKSQTVGSSYFNINSYENIRKYYFWFDKGTISHSFNSTSAVNAGADTITIPNHGYATNDLITFSGVVPVGLSVGVNYYAIRVDANTIQVSATVGGAAININVAVGSATVTHTSIDPTLPNKISVKIPLQIYDDSLDGSKEAMLDTFGLLVDFIVASVDFETISITNADTGVADDVTQSPIATGWSFTVVTQGDGEDILAKEVWLSFNTSPALSIDQTVRSLVKVINRDVDSPVNAYYLSGSDDLPGKILLESKNLIDEEIYVAVNDTSLSNEFSPEISYNSILQSINDTTNVFTTVNPHNLQINDRIYIHDNPGSTPTEFAGAYTVATVPTATTFTLVGVDVLIPQAGPLNGYVYRTTTASNNNKNPNRVYYSKTNQPEAVPLVNYIDVGSKDSAIDRILGLRDNLFILKPDGIFYLTGDNGNFFIRLLDSSAAIIAPDTAVVLNNVIYMLSTQGIVAVSDTGVQVISRNIEDQIKKVTTFAFNYRYSSFAVAYESERSFLMWLPSTKQDNIATQCFRYNTFTKTFTKWTKTNKCGIVNTGDDRLYLGSGVRNFIEQERKNNERQDYADRNFTLSILSNGVDNLSIKLSSIADVEVGDVIVQSQYVDVPKFNRLLKKLDTDTGPDENNYYDVLHVDKGVNLAQSLLALVNKLNADVNLTGFTLPSGVNTPTAIRDDYNTLIDELNSPTSGTSLKDYKTENDELFYEVLVVSVNKTLNTVGVNFNTWILEGNVTIYKAIQSKVEWAPQHFGTPEEFKQIREGTILFDQNNIYSGIIAYASDRSADFSEIPFKLRGPGFWISYPWSEVTFGGSGNDVPVRTLIPMNKQRCRYLTVQFQHFNARESYRIVGISLEPRSYSTRAYR